MSSVVDESDSLVSPERSLDDLGDESLSGIKMVESKLEGDSERDERSGEEEGDNGEAGERLNIERDNVV